MILYHLNLKNVSINIHKHQLNFCIIHVTDQVKAVSINNYQQWTVYCNLLAALQQFLILAAHVATVKRNTPVCQVEICK